MPRVEEEIAVMRFADDRSATRRHRAQACPICRQGLVCAVRKKSFGHLHRVGEVGRLVRPIEAGEFCRRGEAEPFPKPGPSDLAVLVDAADRGRVITLLYRENDQVSLHRVDKEAVAGPSNYHWRLAPYGDDVTIADEAAFRRLNTADGGLINQESHDLGIKFELNVKLKAPLVKRSRGEVRVAGLIGWTV